MICVIQLLFAIQPVIPDIHVNIHRYISHVVASNPAGQILFVKRTAVSTNKKQETIVF